MAFAGDIPLPPNPQIHMLVRQQLQGHVGQDFRIRHLTSEKGRPLNDRICTVIGWSGQRLEAQLKDNGSVVKLKSSNLMPAELPVCTEHGPLASDKEVVECLKDALGHDSVTNVAKRSDVAGRLRVAGPYIRRGEVPPLSQCMDPMVPDIAQADELTRALQVIKHGCVGDGTVDFRRFNAGLVGAGGTCAVCLSAVERGRGALGFPCGHLFHRDCASAWLDTSNSCPTCRMKLGMPGREYAYMFDYAKRMRVRIREWFISGMCERCQAVYHETNPLVAQHVQEGLPRTLVPRSTLDK